jgi:7,8-dihydro-6-hydroxymethylpterin-pyrophosphokinase
MESIMDGKPGMMGKKPLMAYFKIQVITKNTTIFTHHPYYREAQNSFTNFLTELHQTMLPNVQVIRELCLVPILMP